MRGPSYILSYILQGLLHRLPMYQAPLAPALLLRGRSLKFHSRGPDSCGSSPRAMAPLPSPAQGPIRKGP